MGRKGCEGGRRVRKRERKGEREGRKRGERARLAYIVQGPPSS